MAEFCAIMAMKIIVNVSKKLPIPGVEYASQQASCSIEAEATTHDIQAEVAQLYGEAETAVDQQLSAPQRAVSSPNASRPRSSAPSPSQRRSGPPAATDSQLRLLGRLIPDGQLTAILHQYQIGDLRDLDIKQASGLIDELKR